MKTVTRLGGPGFAAGAAAYVLWGLFPLYWPLLEPAAARRDPRAPDRLVGRVRRRRARPDDRLPLGARRSAAAARGCSPSPRCCITVNWGTLIYGVNSGHVVEVSLGYFINPLVTVALAVGVLHERLRPRSGRRSASASLAVVVLDRRLRPAAVDRARARRLASGSTGW